MTFVRPAPHCCRLNSGLPEAECASALACVRAWGLGARAVVLVDNPGYRGGCIVNAVDRFIVMVESVLCASNGAIGSTPGR